MGKSLVIVESPAKAKTINKFLGSEYVVKPTGGHIIDLPPDEFGINLENDFDPKYVVIKGKNKTLQELKKAAKSVDTVLLATDPDREGEAIAWHVARHILGKDQPSFRVLINQITRDAVVNAVRDRGSLDLQKVNAQQARRILDRLVGYKVSPVLWKAMYKGLSAGRVQSVALRLVVERDGQIDGFVPEEYWNISAVMATAKAEEFEAKLSKQNGKTVTISTADEAQKVVDDLNKADFRVTKVQERVNRRNPMPPFITSTLQQDASRRLGFSVSRTMRVAQSLYEGVELADGSTGLITYMRTDSTRIASEALTDVRAYIESTWGKQHLPAKPNFYRARKGAQDAHEAIRPADLSLPPDKVKRYLSNDQFRLYKMIWNRFVATQMKPAEYNVVKVDIAGGDYELRANAKKLVYQGFLVVYKDLAEKKDDENGDDENMSADLPKLAQGDPLTLKKVTQSQHFTKPPARYSEATLVRELEALGIGRPSTYAQIINTIQSRKYVSRERGKLLSTELGREVNKILVEHFPNLFSVNFTANMEEELDKIESGDYEWNAVVHDFYGPFSESLEKFMLKSRELKESMIEETDEVCEKCGRPMVIRWGRNGKFMACSGFPSCKNTRPLEEPEKIATDEVCDKCGSPMEVKNGRYGRFLACSNYPSCKNIKPFALGVKCPNKECNGDIVEKRSRNGRMFYGCNKYPKCRFASWNKPIAKLCPTCGSPTLVESKGGDNLSCPRCKSTFERESIEQ